MTVDRQLIAGVDSLSREDAERLAAVMLRQMARDSFRRHASIARAAVETQQLVCLADRLEAFADVV